MPRIQRHNRRRGGVYWVAMERLEADLLSGYLERNGGDMRATADELGISLQTLYYRCRKLKIGKYAVGRKSA